MSYSASGASSMNGSANGVSSMNGSANGASSIKAWGNAPGPCRQKKCLALKARFSETIDTRLQRWSVTRMNTWGFAPGYNELPLSALKIAFSLNHQPSTIN